jgi:1-acyl-sn-glycerol-3-phosphate acyltransferase
MQWIFKTIFKLCGWKLVMTIPPEVKKGIFSVCPHAVWTDFLIGVGARAASGLKIGYLGKKELFDPPFGFIFKALDGYPVDRSSKNNLVQGIVDAFASEEQLYFGIAPEGTRKDVGRLKSGFYHMAHGSGGAIIMVGFDYPRKTVFMTDYFYPTGDIEADFRRMAEYFSTIQGVQKRWIRNYLEGKFDEK